MQLIESGDNEKYNLPKDFPIDIAHPLFAGTVHAADCLRELAKDPEQDVELMMCCRGGKIADVPRMVIKDSTLGALLPSDKPAKARKTVILLGIGNAAGETEDLTYAFGAGPKGDSKRRCAAKPAILEFLKAIQKELKGRSK